MQNVQSLTAAAFFLFVFAAAAGGCLSEDSGKVEIVPVNECWTSYMSSAVGIGLTAVYYGEEDVTFEWSADYGGFVLWTPEIITCDSPCTTDGTVWWTYMWRGGYTPEEDELPGTVHVTVRAIENSSGRVMAESGIDLVKTDKGVYCTAGPE